MERRKLLSPAIFGDENVEIKLVCVSITDAAKNTDLCDIRQLFGSGGAACDDALNAVRRVCLSEPRVSRSQARLLHSLGHMTVSQLTRVASLSSGLGRCVEVASAGIFHGSTPECADTRPVQLSQLSDTERRSGVVDGEDDDVSTDDEMTETADFPAERDSADSEWSRFLCSINSPNRHSRDYHPQSPPQRAHASCDQCEDETDPDFLFCQKIQSSDEECDHSSYCGVVSRSELEFLWRDLVLGDGQKRPNRSTHTVAACGDKDSLLNTCFAGSPVVRQLPKSLTDCDVWTGAVLPSGTMTRGQVGELLFQLSAHVQLVVQTAVMSAERPCSSWLTERSAAMLRSLQSDSATAALSQSIANLSPALQLLDTIENNPRHQLIASGEILRGAVHCSGALSPFVSATLLQCPACILPGLLPNSGPSGATNRVFTASLDWLLASGLDQFRDFSASDRGAPLLSMPLCQRVANYCVPLQAERIYARCRAARNCHTVRSPLAFYFQCEKSPPLLPLAAVLHRISLDPCVWQHCVSAPISPLQRHYAGQCEGPFSLPESWKRLACVFSSLSSRQTAQTVELEERDAAFAPTDSTSVTDSPRGVSRKCLKRTRSSSESYPASKKNRLHLDPDIGKCDNKNVVLNSAISASEDTNNSPERCHDTNASSLCPAAPDAATGQARSLTSCSPRSATVGEADTSKNAAEVNRGSMCVRRVLVTGSVRQLLACANLNSASPSVSEPRPTTPDEAQHHLTYERVCGSRRIVPTRLGSSTISLGASSPLPPLVGPTLTAVVAASNVSKKRKDLQRARRRLSRKRRDSSTVCSPSAAHKTHTGANWSVENTVISPSPGARRSETALPQLAFMSSSDAGESPLTAISVDTRDCSSHLPDDSRLSVVSDSEKFSEIPSVDSPASPVDAAMISGSKSVDYHAPSLHEAAGYSVTPSTASTDLTTSRQKPLPTSHGMDGRGVSPSSDSKTEIPSWLICDSLNQLPTPEQVCVLAYPLSVHPEDNQSETGPVTVATTSSARSIITSRPTSTSSSNRYSPETVIGFPLADSCVPAEQVSSFSYSSPSSPPLSSAIDATLLTPNVSRSPGMHAGDHEDTADMFAQLVAAGNSTEWLSAAEHAPSMGTVAPAMSRSWQQAVVTELSADQSLGGVLDVLLHAPGGTGPPAVSVTAATSTGCSQRRGEVLAGDCAGKQAQPGSDNAPPTAAKSFSSQQEKPSAATSGGSARNRLKRSRQQLRELEQLRSVMAAENKLEQHEAAVAASFHNRLKAATDAVDPAIYTRVQELLISFSDTGSAADERELYERLCSELHAFPELCSQLLLFFSESVALQCGSMVDRLRVQRTVQLARRTELATTAQPSLTLKVQRSLAALEARFMTSAGTSCSSAVPTAADIRAALQPLLRSCPQLVSAELQQLLDHEPPPDHLVDDPSDFQELNLAQLESSENRGDKTNVMSEERNAECNGDDDDDDGFEVLTDTVLSPASGSSAIDQLYGTAECPCRCHNMPDVTEAVSSRRRHCHVCALKFIDGRVFLKIGKVLRPARLVDSTGEQRAGSSDSATLAEGAMSKSAAATTIDSRVSCRKPRRRPWSRDEDFLLMDTVRSRGDSAVTFRRLQQSMVGRSLAQIKSRFAELIDKLRSHASTTMSTTTTATTTSTTNAQLDDGKSA